MSEVTQHKGTAKLAKSKSNRKKTKFKLLIRNMYLEFELCNGWYFH